VTVRWRLTLIATVVFGVALSVAAFGLVNTVRDKLETSIKDTTEQQLNELAVQLQGGRTPEELGLPAPRVTNDNGQIGAEVQVTPVRGPGEFYEAKRRVGDYVLVAQRSFDEVTATTDSLRNLMFVVVPFLIAAVGFAVWYLAGRALKPVEDIRVQAEAITGTTLDRRVPEPATQDEVGRLARTMNAMLDRLEVSSRKQRQFVSDASHELRSPIASIRTNLEVALRNADRADWPAVATRALQEDERMEEMVTDLLDLARLDEYEETAPVASLPEVDLDELVHDETLRPHRSQIDTTRVSAGRVHGRSEQLARVVRNLLDNADRHARSRVALSLQNGAEVVELTVDDDGPGIAVEDRARVFERFTRLDDGRARDAGGLGLGLSMVKTIVERHGGTVEVGDAPIGGARFAVRLPCA